MLWLLLLGSIQSMSSFILRHAESVLQHHMIITMFIPTFIGISGSAGMQPSIAWLQRMARQKHMRWAQTFLMQEAVLAVATSLLLGLAMYGRVLVEYPDAVHDARVMALTTTLAVFSSIAMGLGLNMTLHRCGMNPAKGAVPLLATAVDVLGVLLVVEMTMAFKAYL